ncbi:MAG: glycerol-3-phosphate acyltransferase [Clostridia bacterium]|nr:glycerol-3-phosphate acyltransferase [Clostridia bacterium]
MNDYIIAIFCILLGYSIGTINPAFFIGKIKGFDIRDRGSKNAGASNAMILLGKSIGIFCALFDIFKAVLAIELARRVIFPAFRLAYALTGTACVLGHMFPFYMKFKGGKGTASLGGMILALNWKLFLIMLGATIIIVLLTDYLCFMPVTASVAFPVIYGIFAWDLWGALIIGLITVAVLIKNIANFKRILSGTELRISYLWKKDKEIDRISKNM